MKEPLLPLSDEPMDDTMPVSPAGESAPSASPTGVTPLRSRARRRVVGLEAQQRRRTRVRYALLAISATFMINAFVGDNGLLATIKAKRQYDSLERDLNTLRSENQQLKTRMQRLKNDPTAIEEEARQNLGLIRPGETLVIVKDAPAQK